MKNAEDNKLEIGDVTMTAIGQEKWSKQQRPAGRKESQSRHNESNSDKREGGKGDTKPETVAPSVV
jgi:hypothetical protein